MKETFEFTDWHNEVLEKAIEKWGEDAQLNIVIGEIGEFLLNFGREQQGRSNKEEWIDEIADVILVMFQMAQIYGLDETIARLEYKFESLEKRSK